MKDTKPDPMAEIHAIRSQLEKRLGGLSREEYCHRVNEEAEKIVKKSGLKLKVLQRT